MAKKHKSSAKPQTKRRVPRDLVLEMRELEVARATDGFLRGKPEPVVMVAVIALEPQPRVIARALWRFEQPSAHTPTTVHAVKPPRAVTAPYEVDDNTTMLLLAIAMEEDSGKDVGRVYGLLERADCIALWKVDAGSIPAPESVAVAALALTSPARVRVLVDDIDVGVRAKPLDDYVGACAVALPRARFLADHRLHLVDDDGKNDWTAVIKVRAQ